MFATRIYIDEWKNLMFKQVLCLVWCHRLETTLNTDIDLLGIVIEVSRDLSHCVIDSVINRVAYQVVSHLGNPIFVANKYARHIFEYI